MHETFTGAILTLFVDTRVHTLFIDAGALPTIMKRNNIVGLFEKNRIIGQKSDYDGRNRIILKNLLERKFELFETKD
jgi:hypothetical protein